MSDRAELLIGGWLAGTLTPDERRELLNAAMSNQALFDALADEEGLRELLADPAVRRELSQLLGPAQQTQTSWWEWLRRPAPLAALGAAALVVVSFLALRPGLTQRAGEAPQEAAKTAPAPIAATADKASPAGGVIARVPEPDAEKPLRAAAPRRDEALPQRVTTAAAPPTPASAPASNAGPTAVPAAPPAPAVAIVTANEAKKAKEEMGTAAESVAVGTVSADLAMAAPISYRVERQAAPGGAWAPLPAAAVLTAGDRARLAITAAQAGTVRIEAGREQLSIRAAAGEVIYYPPIGPLPADPGERAIAVTYLPVGPAALPEVQSAAPAAAARSRRSQPAPGGVGQFTIAVRIVYR